MRSKEKADEIIQRVIMLKDRDGNYLEPSNQLAHSICMLILDQYIYDSKQAGSYYSTVYWVNVRARINTIFDNHFNSQSA